MSHFRRIWLIAALALCGWAGSEDRQPSPAKSLHDPLARQKQSVSAMQSSLDAQRQAIRRQSRQAARQSFFLLPPAPHTLHINPVPACDPLPANEVDSLVGEAAGRQGIDPALLRGVMQQESAFRPCAVSEKGAMGLMQLMPGTAADLGVADPFNPQENLDAGARFLKQLLLLYGGDVGLALGAYNAGPSRVSPVGGIPALPETLDYVQKILTVMPALQ
jgi:soluble lytic murein transglycosylase-like protein